RDGIAAGRRAGATGKPVLACVMSTAARPVPIAVGAERVPAYVFPENAVRALAKAVRYAEWRARPPGLPGGGRANRTRQARPTRRVRCVRRRSPRKATAG